MYEISDILEGLREPYKIVRELNLLYHRRLRSHNYNFDGVDIFSEDWDNLVILDACRYDMFEQLWESSGTLEYRISMGSSSNEFVRGNFRGRELLDTVCVTANGWYFNINDFQVHAMIPLIGEEYRDDETGAVLPETVTKHARRAAEKYPQKRLVIHYMQPHTPYIGPTGRQYFDGFRIRSDINRYTDSSNEFDIARLRTAYRENLEIVLEEVYSLIEILEGKTVVSADHGEMLGERHFPFPMRDYMHPHGIDNEVLVKVPWLIHSHSNRRSIVSEPPQETSDSVDKTAVEEHLQELGYLQ
jgi:hypothetical protein